MSELKEYRVDMSGMACMRGSLIVHAKDKDDAERIAKEKTGDVEWRYGGIDDSTVSVDSVEKR